MRFFEGKRNLNGNKYLLFIKDIYINGYIGERDVCSLVPIFCSHTLIGLYLLCTACAPHRVRSSFFLNKGKAIGSPRPLSGAEGSTSPHLPRRPMGESFWGERQRRWGDDNAPQGGPGAQPRHAFGSFRRETKGTPGVGRVGPLVGAGAPAPAKPLRGGREKKGGRRGLRPRIKKNLLPFAAKYSIINGHDNKNAREGGRAVPQGRTCF